MPTEAGAGSATGSASSDGAVGSASSGSAISSVASGSTNRADLIASRRILRLALGTSLSLGFSQAIAWDLSFIAPVFTMLLLATPAPAPGFGKGCMLVLALVVPVILGSILLMPFMLHLHSVAIILVVVGLFHSLHFTARGGPAAVGSLLTMGLTIVVAIGSVNGAALSAITQGLAMGAAGGLIFVWIAHALLPDPSKATLPAGRVSPKQASAARPLPEEARRKALRALFVVAPIAILFLFSSASTSYIVVMIKAASMGQQSETSDSAQMGRSLLASTVLGGIGAVIAWQVLSIWPSLILYTLLIAIAALVYGRRIFQGAGMHRDAATWSYAFLTMVVLIAPAVLDSASGAAAGAAFWSRLTLIGFTALYGGFAVTVFDAFWPAANTSKSAQGS